MTLTNKAFIQNTAPGYNNNDLIIKAANQWVKNNGGEAKAILTEFGPFLPDLRALALRQSKGEDLNRFETTQLQSARKLLKEGHEPQTIRSQSYREAKKINGGEVPVPDWLQVMKRQTAEDLAAE